LRSHLFSFLFSAPGAPLSRFKFHISSFSSKASLQLEVLKILCFYHCMQASDHPTSRLRRPIPIKNPKSVIQNQPPLSPERESFERGLILVFSELADLFGNPRSHGQIYGLLFSSPVPLIMEEISSRIGISMGSVSNGLRALEELGAVERQINGKFGVYVAKLELKTLISGFVRQRLVPRLEKSNATLKGLSSLIDQMPDGESKEAEFRLQRVIQWHTRAAQFLPLAEKIFGAASNLMPQSDGK
jgi:DNA-binding transcriptional regulator GbsR (MarR family)